MFEEEKYHYTNISNLEIDGILIDESQLIISDSIKIKQDKVKTTEQEGNNFKLEIYVLIYKAKNILLTIENEKKEIEELENIRKNAIQIEKRLQKLQKSIKTFPNIDVISGYSYSMNDTIIHLQSLESAISNQLKHDKKNYLQKVKTVKLDTANKISSILQDLGVQNYKHSAFVILQDNGIDIPSYYK